MNAARHTLTSRDEAQREAALVLKFRDGELTVTPSAARLAPPRKAAPPPPPEQGKLL
jgi:hypothetical protein